jgi:hypothetical protein
MELFRNVRLKIGNSILKKKISKQKRKVYYSNISLVKRMGIVWDGSKTDDFTVLSKFYQKMHERDINVKIICYFSGNNLPDQYTAIRYLSCIKPKELDYFYHPVSTETTDFISNRFHILIDINFDKLVPLQYISTLSDSSFKVGLYESGVSNSPFDLMMDMKKPVDLENYLNQIMHYLEMINSGTYKKVVK